MPEREPNHQSPKDTERLERIESEIAFVSHEQDTLNAQLIKLHVGLDSLAARLGRLEARLESISSSTPQSAAQPDRSQPQAPGDDVGTEVRDVYFDQRPPHWGRHPGRE